MRRLLLTFVALALALAADSSAAALCERNPRAAPALAHLRALLATARFVTYQPTALQVVNGQVHEADSDSIRADLTVLRPHFDALITYDAVHGAQAIAPLAAALKFRALIIGVWNPFDATQIEAAVQTAQRYPRLVAGLSLGNEMLFSHRAQMAQLAQSIERMRARLPAVPLSTSEPFHLYESQAAAELLAQMDFLLVNVHPLFQPWFRTADNATAAQFVVNVSTDLTRFYCGPVLIKETGLPTGPASAGFSESRQAIFYEQLRQRLPGNPTRAFAYFAAFDAPWRTQDVTGVPGPHPEEAYWGLFDAARHGKLAVNQLPPLKQDSLHGQRR